MNLLILSISNLIILILILVSENAFISRAFVFIVPSLLLHFIEVISISTNKHKVKWFFGALFLVLYIELSTKFAISYFTHLLYFPLLFTIYSSSSSIEFIKEGLFLLMFSTFKFIYLIFINPEYIEIGAMFTLEMSLLLIGFTLLLAKKLEEKNSILILQQEHIKELSVNKERERIVRDIHDSIGHSITTLLMNLRVNKRETNSSLFDPLIEQVHDIYRNIRLVVEKNSNQNSISSLIRIVELSELIDFENLLDKNEDISKFTLLVLVIKEGLNNAIRHSIKDSRIKFFLSKDYFEIKNICEKGEFNVSNGLVNMKNRLEEGHWNLVYEKNNVFFTLRGFRND